MGGRLERQMRRLMEDGAKMTDGVVSREGFTGCHMKVFLDIREHWEPFNQSFPSDFYSFVSAMFDEASPHDRPGAAAGNKTLK